MKDDELIAALKTSAKDMRSEGYQIAAGYFDKAAARIEALTAEVDKLRQVLCMAIEWDGHDEHGVEALWLNEARAALQPQEKLG